MVNGLDTRCQRLQRGECLAKLAVDMQSACAGGLRARDDFYEGAFAAAVFTEQVVNLARVDVQRNALERMHARKTLVHALHLQKSRRGRW